MALTLKKKQPAAGAPVSHGLDYAASVHAAKGESMIAKLERKVVENEANAAACMQKGPNYNEALARRYFANRKILQDEINKIKVEQAQAALLASKVEADAYTADTAEFMREIARAQKTAAKRVDIEKVGRTAERMSNTRTELDQASKTVHSAMGGVVDGMLKTKLDDADDADLDEQLRGADPQMSGFDTDFMLWSQSLGAANTTVSTAPSTVPTFDPADRAKEEPAYVKALRQAALREKQAQ
jgi:uncharacterized membrane protein YccC